MVSPALVSALSEARRRVPREAWRHLSAHLGDTKASPDFDTIREAIAGIVNRDAAWLLSEAFRECANLTWVEIAAAMVTIDCLQAEGVPAEIIWTGPTNNRFPVRRIDQVLYDLVCSAQRRIVLVTFAAHRVRHLSQHLADAVRRDVELTLIVESKADSEGQLTANAVSAFRDVPSGKTRILCWPLAQRERNQAGRPGKLHAKCAIVDDVALIGSANLTDDAFNRNMELGILVRDRSTVLGIAAHFDDLARRGVLVEVRRP